MAKAVLISLSVSADKFISSCLLLWDTSELGHVTRCECISVYLCTLSFRQGFFLYFFSNIYWIALVCMIERLLCIIAFHTAGLIWPVAIFLFLRQVAWSLEMLSAHCYSHRSIVPLNVLIDRKDSFCCSTTIMILFSNLNRALCLVISSTFGL